MILTLTGVSMAVTVGLEPILAAAVIEGDESRTDTRQRARG
jgi:hypothetical protein